MPRIHFAILTILPSLFGHLVTSLLFHLANILYIIGYFPTKWVIYCTFQVNKSVYFLHDWYVQILHIAIHDNSQSKSIS